MKILFLARHATPHIGGVEKHMYHLQKELQKHGNDVKILTVDYPKIKGLGLFVIWIKLILRLKKFLSADIVHVHDVFIWYLPIRIILFWKPVITTHHGWEGVYPIPIKNLLLKKMAFYLSDKNIVVGKYINKFYRINAKSVIYGATDKNKISAKTKKIVYLGRLSADTGLPVLLQLLPKMKGYSVEFLGDGELRSLCRKYGKTRGFVKDIDKYLKDAEICFCSGYLSILEAFSFGCKVVVAYDNDLKKSYYLETPFRSWIAASNNPSQIIEKIKKIKKSDIDQAYSWSKKQNWRELCQMHQKLYTDLI